MGSPKKLSIVIPAHNEEGSIEGTVTTLYDALAKAEVNHEILVVNDGSTDRTSKVLASLSIPTLKSVLNEGLHGYGMAVRKGLSCFSGDAVAIYMADASDTPKDLIQFFKTMQETGVDCVFGTRFAKQSKLVDYPWIKLSINRLANWFIKTLFRLDYNDTTNAFKLYQRNVIEGIGPFLSPHFNLTVEMPLKAIIRGFSYTVIPNDWINRKSGISKLQIKEMGSRYLFIVIYCFIEKWLSKGDYQVRRTESGSQRITH